MCLSALQWPVLLTQNMAESKFASLRGILLLAKNHLVGPLSQRLNNSFINPKFVQYIETGIRDSAPPSRSNGGTAVALAPRPAEDGRDPLLVGFERYLLSKLGQADVCKDERGVYLFNVNRVAYLVEKSEDEGQQRITRRRLNAGVPSVQHITRRVPPSNKGEVLECACNRKICLDLRRNPSDRRSPTGSESEFASEPVGQEKSDGF